MFPFRSRSTTPPGPIVILSPLPSRKTVRFDLSVVFVSTTSPFLAVIIVVRLPFCVVVFTLPFESSETSVVSSRETNRPENLQKKV